MAAVLGRHFAAAGEPERALRYYEIAGDHATASFANDEAISSYHAALAIAGEGEAAVELQAKLANVLWRTQRRGQAREAFQAGLRAVPAGDTLRRAHLLTRLGRLEVSDNHYEAAWAAYDAAEDLLGGNPEEMDAATVEEWLELMVDGRACQYTTEHQVEQALATLDAVRPVIGRGSAVRKHGYYFHLAMARVAQNRFRVDETDLDNARRSLAAAADAEEKDVGYATFFLARFLLLHGDVAEAQDHLEHSLALAERIGETALRAYSLLGLAMAALRRHDIAEVRALLPRVLAEARDHSRPRLPGRGQSVPGLAGLAGPAPGRRDQAGRGDRDADDRHARRGALLRPRPPVAAGRRAPGSRPPGRGRRRHPPPPGPLAASRRPRGGPDRRVPGLGPGPARPGPGPPDRRPGPGPRPRLPLIRMPRASSPASGCPDTSALCACATWCRPNTESIPGRSPIRSSHWLTARLASARPNRGISATFSASSNVASSSSSRGTTRLTMPTW